MTDNQLIGIAVLLFAIMGSLSVTGIVAIIVREIKEERDLNKIIASTKKLKLS